ncbi:hypothetical protein BDV96DRAFT_626873 [Lophiotrema nucula]|uniref:Uncharacterized protein n=1 Tax=Lophiotrema nucula TaxID=690887 RepID=A0A6A5ZWH3_9PLEO|nr:hypothetical protein BDV96DRAFT_626873 [Lophiotrema nucula]
MNGPNLPNGDAAAAVPVAGSQIRRWNTANFIYFLLMAASTSFAVVVVVPDKWLSWKLGLQNQLIVVGIMLRIMTECLQVHFRHLLLLWEYQVCRSRLQNYESILTNNWLVPKSTWRIRITVFTTIGIPFVLSAVYKLHIDGKSTRKDGFDYGNKTYGINYPSLGQYAGFNDSIYLFTNAYSDFQLAVSSTEDAPHSENSKQAIPYGYNMLLLSNTSAAALDIPSPDYILKIQEPLAVGDS